MKNWSRIAQVGGQMLAASEAVKEKGRNIGNRQ